MQFTSLEKPTKQSIPGGRVFPAIATFKSLQDLHLYKSIANVRWACVSLQPVKLDKLLACFFMLRSNCELFRGTTIPKTHQEIHYISVAIEELVMYLYRWMHCFV